MAHWPHWNGIMEIRCSRLKKNFGIKPWRENYAYEMENTVRNKVVVTPGEVEKFFKRLPKDSVPLIPEQYVYAQIIRFPSSREEAKMRAQTKLLELRERILNGEKFETLARIYSRMDQRHEVEIWG